MCTSSTVVLLVAFYMNGILSNFCHVTFIIAFLGGSFVVAVFKTTRTYSNYFLLVRHLAITLLGNLIIYGLLDALR